MNYFKSSLATRFREVTSGFQSAERSSDDLTDRFLMNEMPYLEDLCNRAENADTDGMPLLSQEFTALRERIEAEITRETGGETEDPAGTMDETVRSMWYLAVHGARAQDVYDWQHILKPQYDDFESSLPTNLTPEQMRTALACEQRSLIESIRLQKQTEHSEVVEAMFPYLPFKNDCFDRFVAFWSISTYVFPHLTEEEMYSYWEEIYRVLKDGGRAHIYPLYNGNEGALDDSLQAFQNEHPDFDYSFPSDEYGNGDDYLVIEKNRSSL